MTYQRNRPDVTRPVNLGDRFGRWEVIDPTRIYQWVGSRNRPFVSCRCNCGTERLVSLTSLRHKQGSCGCGQKEWASIRFTKDGSSVIERANRKPRKNVGESKTLLYRKWRSMIRRCEVESASNYKWYGGRGITVCEEWQEFAAFKAWAGSSGYVEGLELDRKNNEKGYSPKNCRWLTKIDNLANRRAYLTPKVETALQREARRQGKPAYALVRRAVVEYLRAQRLTRQ